MNRWRNDNPHFAAELNRQRKQLLGGNEDRLRALATKAIDTIDIALDGGESKVALEVLKAVALYEEAKPPAGPVDAELVKISKAKEWAELELDRRGPSGDRLMDLLTRDEDVAILAQERMEQLRRMEA